MKKKIFLVIGVFIAIFFGTIFGVLTFFKKNKKNKSVKEVKKKDLEDEEKIVKEANKEWEKYNV